MKQTYHIIRFNQDCTSYVILEDSFIEYSAALKYLDKYEILDSNNQNNLYLITSSLTDFLTTQQYDKEKLISLQKKSFKINLSLEMDSINEDVLLEKIKSFCKENAINYKLN
jgi:hypothetical protein